MTSSTHFVLCLTLFILTNATAKPSSLPKALVLPVKRDHSTLEYYTTLKQRTPQVEVSLTVDLGGPFLWVQCEFGYVSSTYRPAHCGSAQCFLAGSTSCGQFCFSPPGPNCNNNTCNLFPDNAILGEVASDVVLVQSTEGRTVILRQFIFSCADDFLTESLAGIVSGKAGLGRTNISLPSQFSSAFGFQRKFALCLASSTNSTGVIIFGDPPYGFLPGIDVSNSLSYTPLINTVSSTGSPSSEYYIGVTSIKINGKDVPINKTLLSIDSSGVGGTKISTMSPYTVLESSIFRAVTDFFVNELSGVPRVKPVAPFEACFKVSDLSSTRVGLGVPIIDFMLQSKNLAWRIVGANSMVFVNHKVACLGFVDALLFPRASIIIGGHQIEDNLLLFDLASSTLGFSSSLLFRQTNCANFNFTTQGNDL